MRTGSFVLSARDRRFLEQFRSQGGHLARELTCRHVLLALADSVPVAHLQQARSAYEEKGLDYAVHDAARSGPPFKHATAKGRREGSFGA